MTFFLIVELNYPDLEIVSENGLKNEDWTMCYRYDEIRIEIIWLF